MIKQNNEIKNEKKFKMGESVKINAEEISSGFEGKVLRMSNTKILIASGVNLIWVNEKYIKKI